MMGARTSREGDDFQLDPALSHAETLAALETQVVLTRESQNPYPFLPSPEINAVSKLAMWEKSSLSSVESKPK
jgi:hypothetical protein